jgi:hypothetical protein
MATAHYCWPICKPILQWWSAMLSRHEEKILYRHVHYLIPLTAKWIEEKWLMKQIWWKRDKDIIVGNDWLQFLHCRKNAWIQPYTQVPWDCTMLPCETHVPTKLTCMNSHSLVGNRPNKWKPREIVYDFDKENVLNECQTCFILNCTSLVINFLTKRSTKKGNVYVNHMGEFFS